MKPNPGRIEDIFTQIIVTATEIYPPHMKERHLLPPFYFRQALRALQTKFFTTSHGRAALKHRSAAHGKLMIKLVDQGGGGELGSLFVRTILAIVTSRREKRATSRSFRKWRRCHFQMLLLKLVFLDIDAPKWFLSR